MHTKLTLSLDALSTSKQSTAKKLPLLTASLVGVLKGRRMNADAYKAHLRKKYL